MQKLKIRIYLARVEGYIDMVAKIPDIKDKEESERIVKCLVGSCKTQLKDREIFEILVDYKRINQYSNTIYLNGKTLNQSCLYIPTIDVKAIDISKYFEEVR